MKTNMAAPKKKKTETVKKVRKAVARKAPAKKKKVGIRLKKVPHNPIIEPGMRHWESKATFNPAAFLAGGKVHLIYRAIGNSDHSVLGYASSDDGYHIKDRFAEPIYQRSNNFNKADKATSPIDYISGGGWNGGCEDPRVTLLGDTVYMLYTAFDGWGSLRIALTSLGLGDFKKKKWRWKKPVLISPPGQINKNWVLFPEKIKGKFAILHSISPEILIEYVDNMDEFDGKKFIQSVHQDHPKWQLREKGLRGIGPTPIKTSLGWLVLYHAIEEHDSNRYKLFAMILDIKNPSKILYRSSYPILEPEEHYENNGYKGGVVYACGAVVKNGTLFVYYGGADKVICVASIELSTLLEDLKKHKAVKLKKQVAKF